MFEPSTSQRFNATKQGRALSTKPIKIDPPRYTKVKFKSSHLQGSKGDTAVAYLRKKTGYSTK